MHGFLCKAFLKLFGKNLYWTKFFELLKFCDLRYGQFIITYFIDQVFIIGYAFDLVLQVIDSLAWWVLFGGLECGMYGNSGKSDCGVFSSMRCLNCSTNVKHMSAPGDTG